jgi:hypothetical protein
VARRFGPGLGLAFCAVIVTSLGRLLATSAGMDLPVTWVAVPLLVAGAVLIGRELWSRSR